jgi:alpha,alpha-trehalase
MYYTAKGMLLNMLSIIDEYGFMPNGGRIYYLNRSQPPLLTSMIHQYYTKTQDTDLLARALPTLDKEYHWWMTNRSVVVELGSRSFMLNLFNVTNDTPRPESYSEDFHVAHSLPTQHAQDLFYANIAGGAETGWDFSTRWFGPTNVLGSIQVSDIVPVDLNSIMYVNEVLLSHFHFLVGDKNGMSKFYYHQAMSRLDAIRNVFWDQSRSQWYRNITTPYNTRALFPLAFDSYRLCRIDYDWKERKPRNDKSFYVSNIMPLWASAAHNVANTSAIEGILNALKIPLSFPGGVPTSLQPSGQQWDFPNAWPPLQSFMVCT